MAQLEGTAERSLMLEDELELESIYRTHSATVSKWIRRLWGPSRREATADVEDLLHEVFLVVQRRLGTFRGQSAVSTWLYSITVRVVTARRRKNRLRRLLWRNAEPELESEIEQAASEPASAELFRNETARLVYAVLDELAERDRTLLILFELERLPGAEIAAIVEISERNLWVALTRARARFKKIFERRYGDAEPPQGAHHGQP